VTARLNTTFASLVQSPNYRRYFIGQSISLAGTWMQSVAQGWLVLKLTGSGTAVGLVVALQFVPVLLLGPLGGVLVDRVDTRRLLIASQAVAGALALTLGILTVTDVVELWMVYLLAAGLGLVTVVDNPARQTFVLELVGPDLLTNAITLNSVNAATYVAVIVALMRMNPGELAPKMIVPRAKGQVREGLRYVWATPALRTPLVMMGIIGTLSYEFQVVLPIFARFTFDGTAGTYGVLTAAMGVGAVVGGLVTASRSRSGVDALVRVSVVFGIVILATAWSPTLPVAIGALVAVGAASITFLARANTTMQLGADPAMRGRVMALWTMAFLGSTPIGGPIMGYIGEHLGARWALTIGGTAAIAAAGYGWLAGHAADRHTPPVLAGQPALAPSSGN
jgi:MFS family permease